MKPSTEHFGKRDKIYLTPSYLTELASASGASSNAFKQSLLSSEFSHLIIPFKELAYSQGITHVTTFKFQGEQCAEAPYSTIKDLAERHLAWYGG